MIWYLLNEISNRSILHADRSSSIALNSILIQHTFCLSMILLLRILLLILITSLSWLVLFLRYQKIVCLIWILILFVSLRFIFVHFRHIYYLTLVFGFLWTHKTLYNCSVLLLLLKIDINHLDLLLFRKLVWFVLLELFFQIVSLFQRILSYSVWAVPWLVLNQNIA